MPKLKAIFKGISILLLGGVLFSSCQESDRSLEQSLIDSTFERKSFSALVLIPGSGCGSCIDEAKRFFRKHVSKNEDIMFVFSCFNSEKKLKLDFGQQYFQKSNIYLDKEDQFCFRSTSENLYPQIWYLDNGRVVDIDLQNPENLDSFSKLEKKIQGTSTNSFSTIDLENKYDDNKSLSIKQLASDIDYIPLETTKNNVIGEIDKFISIDGGFVLSTRDAISLFRQDGTFLSQINAKGKGPNEYLTIRDFTIDVYKKEIFLLDGKKIIRFSFDGEALGSFPLNISISNISLIDDLLYCFVPDYFSVDSTVKCNIYLLDKSGNQINRICVENTIKKPLFFSTPATFFNYNQALFYKNPFQDIVFQVKDSELTPHLKISQGQLMMPHTIFETQDEYAKYYKDYIFVADIFETDPAIFFRYVYGDLWGAHIYVKENQKSYNILSENRTGDYPIINDIDGMAVWPSTVNENSLIQVIEAFDFKERVARLDKANLPVERIVALKEIAQNLKDEDNPVIQLVKLN